ncbi:MAG: hypothetical protein ACK48Y_25355, partial [Planctomyces sp.]
MITSDSGILRACCEITPDVWICSDLQRSGWQPTSGRWNDVRQQLSRRQGLRMYLLLYGDDGPE